MLQGSCRKLLKYLLVVPDWVAVDPDSLNSALECVVACLSTKGKERDDTLAVFEAEE